MSRVSRLGMSVVMAAFVSVAASGYGMAADTDDVAALKKEITALQAKVAELEKNQASKPASAVAPAAAVVMVDDQDFYDPFEEMAVLQRQMDAMMGHQFGMVGPRSGFGKRMMSGSVFNPGYDIKGTDKAYVITFDMPGMDKSKINVEVKNGMLLVSGERSSQAETNDPNNKMYRQERSFGYFSKSIPVPKDAKPDSVQAKYDNGVLTVTIDKKESAPKKEDKAQKIEVK